MWFLEAEWTEWFDRDDERGSGDWEKLSDLHKAFPERLCSNPLDIEVNICLDELTTNVLLTTHLLNASRFTK